MPRVGTVRQRDLDRVMKSLSQAGQLVGRVEVRPTGEIIVFPALGVSPVDSNVDDLDGWRAQRADRQTKGT